MGAAEHAFVVTEAVRTRLQLPKSRRRSDGATLDAVEHQHEPLGTGGGQWLWDMLVRGGPFHPRWRHKDLFNARVP
jgi:hypothetical protein